MDNQEKDVEKEAIELLMAMTFKSEEYLREHNYGHIELLMNFIRKEREQKEIYRQETHRWKEAYDPLNEKFKSLESKLSVCLEALKVVRCDCIITNTTPSGHAKTCSYEIAKQAIESVEGK